MAGASLLAIECQPSRIEMRLKTGYLDAQAKDLDEALAMMDRAGRERKPGSIALLGNAAEMLPELVRRGVKPDAVTDQTSAHAAGELLRVMVFEAGEADPTEPFTHRLAALLLRHALFTQAKRDVVGNGQPWPASSSARREWRSLPHRSSYVNP